MLLTTKSASPNLFFNINHRGLYGIFLRIIKSDKIPTNPIANKYCQLAVSPMIILSIAAKDAPKCHVPSIPMLTLPRYLGGRNSSIAVNMAVNYPPTLH